YHAENLRGRLLLLTRLVAIAGELGDLFLRGDPWTLMARALRPVAALRRCRFAGARFCGFAISVGALSHCLRQGLRSASTIAYRDTITAGITDPRNGVRRSFCTETIRGSACPLWVKSGHWRTSSQCPLYPQKRTSLTATGMSALCQKRTSVRVGR